MSSLQALNEYTDSLELNSNVLLMAEDNPADAALFSEMLNQAFGGSYSVVCVDRFEKIAGALSNGTFQALILDMDLPDRSGVDNVYQIGKQYPTLPIVVLTGNDDLELAIDSLQKGAQDYLSKNKVTSEMLARSLNYARERKNIEQRLKEALDEAAYKNDQLEVQAKHDPLTGLANRTYFRESASRLLYGAERKGQLLALLYFDLNDFKKVNDSYGHVVGDELLKKVSSRLEEVVRGADIIARMGGDEFVVMTDVLKSKREIYPLARRIRNQFEKAFNIGLHEIIISPSIGIAFFPEANTLDLLIKHADCAMYEAKKNPSTNICFYSGQVAALYARSQKIEHNLRGAIEQQEITAVFQPVISTKDQELVNVEALARWQSIELGAVSPAEFMPLAENTPIINGVTRLVTDQCYKFYREMTEYGAKFGKISINVTAKQMSHRLFGNLFLKWLDEIKIDPRKICLELTERQIIESIENSKRTFNELRHHGIKIALDDFGSGFSSIAHLLELPFDVLKLDRLLINHIDRNPRNEALVAGAIEMAHRLDMKVTAEGVERLEEKNKAIELGCDYLQGFLISRPLSLNEAILFYEIRNNN